MCSRRHGRGRVRSTTPAEDRYIVLSAKRTRRTTAQQVENQFLAASGKQISRKTVARRLRGGGLYARRPVVYESRFSLSSDCRRQLIWRESGTAYRPENIQEKDRYPTCSIMVWAGIMINGRTRLHVVANRTMTGQRYIDEVLLPHVRLFRGAVGDKFVFMDDNATYLNPIENVWDALGRQVAGRNYPLTNKNTLIRALTEEWDKLPQQLLDNVVQIRRLSKERATFFWLWIGVLPLQTLYIPRKLVSQCGTIWADTNHRRESFHFPPYMNPPCPRLATGNRNENIVAWFGHSSSFFTLQHHGPPIRPFVN
ncbi:transposable element Tcb1 transposase [Trichonephila clavipes]|nr:transposable element Tcb1 transposase [Trichonephila clavipes]